VIHPLGTSLEFFSVNDVRYHGHNLQIHWDKKTGLRVIVDEIRNYSCPAGENVSLEIVL